MSFIVEYVAPPLALDPGMRLNKWPRRMVDVDHLKNVECYRYHMKSHANKWGFPEAKLKDSKGNFKVRKVEGPVVDKASEEPKSIKRIRILFWKEDNDPFIRYCIKVYKNQRSGDRI